MVPVGTATLHGSYSQSTMLAPLNLRHRRGDRPCTPPAAIRLTGLRLFLIWGHIARLYEGSRSAMTFKKRAMLVAVATVVMATMTVSAIDTRPATVRARDFFVTDPTTAPSTLEELSALSYEYRREATRRMSRELKTSLWHKQLQTFAAQRQLTTEQAEFIEAVIANLKPLVRNERTPENQDALEILCKKAPTLFAAEDLLHFGALGGPRTDDDADSTVRRLAKRVKSAFGLLSVDVSATFARCDCTSSWCQDCHNNQTCKDETGCTAFPDDCGCWQAFECNDLCVATPIAGDSQK